MRKDLTRFHPPFLLLRIFLPFSPRNIHGWLLEAPWEDKPSRFFFPERHGAQCRHFISFLHRYLAGSIRHDAPAVTFATARGARPDHELLNDDFCALCKQGEHRLSLCCRRLLLKFTS